MIILSKIFISAIIIDICIIFALVVINTIIDFKNKNINKIVGITITYLTNTFAVLMAMLVVQLGVFLALILWGE